MQIPKELTLRHPTSSTQAGEAEVVRIHYMIPKEDLLVLLGKLNGVFFPGGGHPINIQNRWAQAADMIVQYSIQVNNEHPDKPFLLCEFVWGMNFSSHYQW